MAIYDIARLASHALITMGSIIWYVCYRMPSKEIQKTGFAKMFKICDASYIKNA